MLTDMAVEVRAAMCALTEKQCDHFLKLFDRAEWHRLPHMADRIGGRARNHERTFKLVKLGLIEHRVNAGAEYRLTPLGYAARAATLARAEVQA